MQNETSAWKDAPEVQNEVSSWRDGGSFSWREGDAGAEASGTGEVSGGHPAVSQATLPHTRNPALSHSVTPSAGVEGSLPALDKGMDVALGGGGVEGKGAARPEVGEVGGGGAGRGGGGGGAARPGVDVEVLANPRLLT